MSESVVGVESDAAVGRAPVGRPSSGQASIDPNAVYSLGSSGGESERLQRQADESAPESKAVLDRAGVRSGHSAIDLGCGPRGVDEAEIAKRKRRYEKSLAMIEEQAPGSRLASLLRFELEALTELPPQASGWNEGGAMSGPPFELRESETDDGTLRLSLLGTLAAASVPAVEQRLHELRILARPVRLDLSRLEAIDITGVELLAAAHADARLRRWRFEIEPGVSPAVASVLRLAHLNRVVENDT